MITQFLRDSFFKKALKAKSDILRDFHNKALKELSDIRKERLFIFQEKLNYFFAATEAHMFQPQVNSAICKSYYYNRKKNIKAAKKS